MSTIIVTGSGGLVGSEAVRHYAARGDLVLGIDNDYRSFYFGEEASTSWSSEALQQLFPRNFRHFGVDIRDEKAISAIFQQYSSDISLIIHAAAQPSHDWAAKQPEVDFTVNANGTLVMLEQFRKHAPKAVFIFTSTNKVYGDRPNSFPYIEQQTRWELPLDHPSWNGFNEQLTIDQSTHSLFGVSKIAADLLVQEYGRYFGLLTGVFRAGCLTGPMHSGTALHGFLAYLMKCVVTGTEYSIIGHKGKQVRDNIHSADLIAAFDSFYREPKIGAVYNIGGSRANNCSVFEAIALCGKIAGKKLRTRQIPAPRIGDHQWWISDVRKFQADYPEWRYRFNLESMLGEIYQMLVGNWNLLASSETTNDSLRAVYEKICADT